MSTCQARPESKGSNPAARPAQTAWAHRPNPVTNDAGVQLTADTTLELGTGVTYPLWVYFPALPASARRITATPRPPNRVLAPGARSRSLAIRGQRAESSTNSR